MPTVTAKLRVNADGSISGRAPAQVPPGEHEAVIVVTEDSRRRPAPGAQTAGLPLRHRCWTRHVAFRREEIYGDEGR
jgi:hypothetical protein